MISDHSLRRYKLCRITYGLNPTFRYELFASIIEKSKTPGDQIFIFTRNIYERFFVSTQFI